jgi:hypothetical protein
METLSGKPLLRRVLASLPAWYSEEDEARLDAEAAREGHVRARRHSFDEMVSEMQGNPHALIAVEASTTTAENQPQSRPMTAEEVQRCLGWLAAQGWATVADEEVPHPDKPEVMLAVSYWSMTQAGFEELHRPEAAPENVVPGPVEIKPQAATEGVHAEMGVSADA